MGMCVREKRKRERKFIQKHDPGLNRVPARTCIRERERIVIKVEILMVCVRGKYIFHPFPEGERQRETEIDRYIMLRKKTQIYRQRKIRLESKS